MTRLGSSRARLRGSRWLAAAPIAAALLALLGPPRSAAADVRLWERDEQGEDEHRYFDVTGYLQPRLVWRQNDRLAGRSTDSIDLHRVRTGFRSRLLWWLELRTSVELAGGPRLADAYVDLPLHELFMLRIGQFRVPFLRAYQLGAGHLGFVDRPIYTPLPGERPFLPFLTARDVGLMVRGHIGDPNPASRLPVLQYRLGVFQGEGPNALDNDDAAYMLVARLHADLLGVPDGVRYENDLARNETPRVGVGAGVYSNCGTARNWNRGVVGDAELRWEGLFSSAAFVWFRSGGARGKDVGEAFNYDRRCVGQPTGAPREHVSAGARWQLQYVLPQLLFPVEDQALGLLARFDWVSPRQPFTDEQRLLGAGEGHPRYERPAAIDDPDNAPTQWRLTFGVTWFPTAEQRLKLQLDYQHKRESEQLSTPEGLVGSVDDDLLWLQLTAGL